MDNEERPFVMFKFLTYGEREFSPEDDELFEVGLAKWITVLDENMTGKIKWPPCDAGNFVRKEKSSCPDWKEESIIVRRFYDTYIKALTSCKGVIEDSTYETEKEFGRGKRKKKRVNRFDSESEEESDDEKNCNAKLKRIKKDAKSWKNTKRIMSPPPVPASFSNYNMVSPETIRRQHTKQSEKSCSLNILIHEPSKKSNVFGKKKEECRKKWNKTSQKRLKVQDITEQTDSPCSINNIIQEDKMCETQETTKFPLETVDEEPTVKEGGAEYRNLKRQIDRQLPSKKTIFSAVSFSPLKNSSRNNINANNMKENDSHRSLFKTNEKNHSRSKSPESERYYDRNSNPSELEEKISSASSASREYYSQLQSTDKASENDSSLQALLLKCIYKIDKNTEITKIMNSKLDISIMNSEKLCRYLLPGEKVVKLPTGHPSFPIETEDELNNMETFLEEDNNLSAASFYFAKYIDSKSVENSVRKLLTKLISNSVASNYSFHGSRSKKPFEKLKLWELVLGALTTCFEVKNLSVCDKVAGTWLANAPWRKQDDGSVRHK